MLPTIRKSKYLFCKMTVKLKRSLATVSFCDLVAEQHDREVSGELQVFSFCDIMAHQGPLGPQGPNYEGSSYNVLVTWEDGTET